MRYLLAVAFCFVLLGLSAQNSTALIDKCLWCKLNPKYFLSEQIAPANASEKAILQRADSSLIAYLKKFRADNADYKNVDIYDYRGFFNKFGEVEKYLDEKPLDEYTLSGYWNNSFDTLYVWAVSPMYWTTIDGLSGKYRPFCLPLNKYADFMRPADYTAYLNLLMNKTKAIVGLRHDDENDVDIATETIDKDTIILAQAHFEQLIRYMLDAFQEGSCDPYKDYYLTERRYSEDNTHMIDPPPQDTTRFFADKLVVVDEWTFNTAPAIQGLPQVNYGYGFIGVRKKISIGEIPTAGDKHACYTAYPDFKRHLNYNSRHGFDAYEQAIESVLYRRYKIKNEYDDW